MKYEILGNFSNVGEIETDKTGKELFEYYSNIVESADFKNKATLCHASCRPIVICFKCGKNLSESDKFCSECGSTIKALETSVAYKLTSQEEDTGICKCGRVTEIIDGEYFCKYCGQKITK